MFKAILIEKAGDETNAKLAHLDEAQLPRAMSRFALLIRR